MAHHLSSNQENEMSPMTDLALNLSGLSTFPQTPCRRISWSNPHPSGQKTYAACDSPFALDSPSFQEGVLRGIELNVKGNRKHNKVQPLCKFLFGAGDQDKENAHEFSGESGVTTSSRLATKSQPNSIGNQDSQSDMSGASQESGFCDLAPEKRSDLSFMSHSSIPSVRSSVFTDDEMEDDETLFSMDKYIDDESVLNVSSSMNQLLTKPLAECNDGFSNSPDFTFNKTVESVKAASECFPLAVPQGLCLEVLHGKVGSPSSSMTLATKFPLDEPVMDENSNDDSQHCQVIKVAFKRPEPLDGTTPLQTKRRKSSPNVKVPLSVLENQPVLYRSYSETATTIMKAVQKADQQPDLIGDCSRPFALPLIHGRHQDLRSISPETLVGLMNGEYSSTVKHFTLIDCRYPYEYDGGHIIGAKNIFTKEDIYSVLLSGAQLPYAENECENLIIFHCEFSSERAPKLLRFLRSKDRELNEHAYPRLHHPEIYLLEGGYKSFYEKFKQFCEPPAYKPMLHEDHAKELREFRSKSKSFGNDCKIRPRLRSNLKF